MVAGETRFSGQAEEVGGIPPDREGGRPLQRHRGGRPVEPHQAGAGGHHGPSRQRCTRPGRSRARAANNRATSTMSKSTKPGIAPSGVVTRAALRA